MQHALPERKQIIRLNSGFEGWVERRRRKHIILFPVAPFSHFWTITISSLIRIR